LSSPEDRILCYTAV